MPLRTINMSGSEYTIVPAGKYKVLLSSYEDKESQGEKTFGEPMITWKFTISEGEQEGKPLYYSCVLTDGKNFSLHRLLRASGIYDAKKINSDNFKFDPDKLLGLGFVAEVIHKDGYANIKSLRSGDEWTGGDKDWE